MDDDDEPDFCEGCGVRDTGDNFNHPGLCKRCNAHIMGMDHEDLLNSKTVGEQLATNSTVKGGKFASWDDAGTEVEVRLNLP
jgi:hypothetical protein